MTSPKPQTSTRVSTCIECATTILGDRLRCPACHDQHATRLLASGDEDVTLPRPRTHKQSPSIWKGFVEGFVVVAALGAVQFLIIAAGVAIAAIAAGKSCR